jgi:hypothetical protein
MAAKSRGQQPLGTRHGVAHRPSPRLGRARGSNEKYELIQLSAALSQPLPITGQERSKPRRWSASPIASGAL